MTIASVRLIGPAVSLETFQAAAAAFPRLFDKDYLREFYSADLLLSAAAREKFIDPDKRAFRVLK